MSDLDLKIRDIIEKSGSLQISIDKISSDDVLKDFGFNSIRYMSIIIDIENEFDIKFNIEDITTDNFKTINKISETIKKYIA